MIISDVNDGERVIITPATVARPLSDPDALRDIRGADAAYASGDVVRSVDAVRNLRRLTEQDNYELVLTPPARRALIDQHPEAVATAEIDFLATTLIGQPRRVGKPLRGELSGLWEARRGTYRVLYRLNEERREVIVVRVDHRRDAFRPR